MRGLAPQTGRSVTNRNIDTIDRETHGQTKDPEAFPLQGLSFGQVFGKAYRETDPREK